MIQWQLRCVVGLGIVIMTMPAAARDGQKDAPAEIAASLSGTWKLNRELSPSVGGPGRGGPAGAPGRGAPSFAIAGAPFGQRGGGGGGGMASPSTSADLTPDVLAAQAAMRELQQIAEVITVKASADSIAISDPRGESTFAIDNKSSKLTANGGTLDVKTRWDKRTVRQEFSSPQTRLVRSWEVDDQSHLVLKVKVESMTMNSKEVKAVYDRQ